MHPFVDGTFLPCLSTYVAVKAVLASLDILANLDSRRSLAFLMPPECFKIPLSKAIAVSIYCIQLIFARELSHGLCVCS